MAGPNLKNVDLNLLVIFDAVYAAGNISHAAVQLGMSQPAVSNALNRLRDLLGDPLFVRDKRGVLATVRAEAVIGPVRDALGLIGLQFDAGKEIDLATYKRTFRIIMIDPLEPLVMPSICREIDAKAPGIGIESYPSYRSDFSADVLAGRIDLAVYVYPINAPQIVAVPLCSVEPVIVARRGHPAIGRTLDAETFQKLGHILLVSELRGLSHVEKDLVAHRLSRRAVYTVTKIWSIAPMVQRTDLLGMLPRRFAEEIASSFNIEIHEPPVPLSAQHFYMMWNAKSTNDPGHRWLREAITKAAEAAAAPSNVIETAQE